MKTTTNLSGSAEHQPHRTSSPEYSEDEAFLTSTGKEMISGLAWKVLPSVVEDYLFTFIKRPADEFS